MSEENQKQNALYLFNIIKYAMKLNPRRFLYMDTYEIFETACLGFNINQSRIDHNTFFSLLDDYVKRFPELKIKILPEK